MALEALCNLSCIVSHARAFEKLLKRLLRDYGRSFQLQFLENRGQTARDAPPPPDCRFISHCRVL